MPARLGLSDTLSRVVRPSRGGGGGDSSRVIGLGFCCRVPRCPGELRTARSMTAVPVGGVAGARLLPGRVFIAPALTVDCIYAEGTNASPIPGRAVGATPNPAHGHRGVV